MNAIIFGVKYLQDRFHNLIDFLYFILFNDNVYLII